MEIAMSAGALDGVRVLDVSRVLAGPYCGQMLGDHGAHVIKVESPLGDDARAWGPPFVADDISAYYAGLNRNKRSVILDLNTEPGRDVFRRLLADVDILVENFKVGTLDRWGFSDAHLEAEFPRLIHARVSGFGVGGPRGGVPGYDAVLQAYSGIMSVNGTDGPTKVGMPIVDIATGMLTFTGVLLALYERERSGRGQTVDCSLLDTAVTLLHPFSINYLTSGQVPVQTGSAHVTVAPYDVFEAGDGQFVLCVGNERQFRDLAKVLDDVELREDPRFATNAGRLANRDHLKTRIEAKAAQWTRDELVTHLTAVGVPCGPVHTIKEALEDSQVHHHQMVVELEGYRVTGVPIQFSRNAGSIRSAPRHLGQDTVDVLLELGYDEEFIKSVQQGIPLPAS